MNRSIITTVDKMLPLIPDSEPLKAELEEWRESVFMELPEANAHLWVQVAAILDQHFPPGGREDLNKWQLAVALAWRGEAIAGTQPQSQGA